MLLNLKKSTDDKSQPNKRDKRRSTHTADASAVAGFIPYYCHYNANTLITKNGELLQTIIITANMKGLDYENSPDQSAAVREAIREAISTHIISDKIACWIHTIRKRRSIKFRGKFNEPFATTIHDRWQKKHRWKFQYYNEIYISVLHDGQNAELSSTSNLQALFITKKNREYRNSYIDRSYKELNKTVSNIISVIGKNFNARRLTIVERVPPQDELPANQPLFYSELLEFLGQLLNLRQETYLLPELDLSEALSSTSQTFGFNALETKNEAGKRRFASILTLKQYREMPVETVDKLLQIPMEFILTQSFHFVPHTGALKQYKEQKEILEWSGDAYCIQASGIEDMLSSHLNHATDFGEHQTSIMVLTDEYKQLDSEIIRIQAAFAELGLITIREDVKLEECFWSQLPGNFEFLRRRDTINTIRVAGFCRLNRYPQGTATNNHWGEALTIFPTSVGSPYFFNFHHQDNGHTVIIDFNSFNDNVCTVFTNFLLAQARKYGGRIYIFDHRQSANLFFRKMAGEYYFFPTLSHSTTEKLTTFNPFLLEDTPRNRSFLTAWCGTLISPEQQIPDSQKEILKEAVDRLYEKPKELRKLETLVSIVAASNVPLAKAFAKWHGEGVYANLFSADAENFDPRSALNAFDMDPLVKNKDCLIPVFSYLLHRIITEVNGEPAILVLHEAWDLISNYFIAPRIESLMEMLQQNNAMIIFTTSKPLASINSQAFDIVVKNCASQIIIPDDLGRNYVSMEGLALSDYDSSQLLKMERQNGDFLLKQNSETISLQAAIKDLDDIYSVLSNDFKNLASALRRPSEKSSESGKE